MPPDADDYRWLTSADGAEALAQTAAQLKTTDVARVVVQLRQRFPAARCSLLVSQVELRRRALAKFAAAERMFFADVALQQASGETVARHKARRFPAAAPVLDLCCGIGGDALALAERGPVTAIDRNESLTILAQANLCTAGHVQYAVQCADVTQAPPPAGALVHIDPDRRPAQRRTTHVSLHEPSDAFLSRLIETVGGGAIKLAPGTAPPDAWRDRCHWEWISHDRECKQLVAWFGSLAAAPGATATRLIGADGQAASRRFDVSAIDLPPPLADRVGRFVYDADPALVAARLHGAMALECGLAATAPGASYLTGDALVDDGLLAAFETLEVLPLDVKRLKAALRARRIGRLEIKKRGIDVSPEDLRKKLALAGDEEAVVLATLHGGKAVAILARRVKTAGGGPRNLQLA
ncbi:MAG: hypothetical protein KDA41_09775 [Planctomycetales bacterium]|nr:hypothetical protein [Planctomycetales bacterium]